jgi:RNA polymerase sigma-70 factor (ECF subfamily)
VQVDDEFVIRLKAGDEHAYECLVHHFEAPLYRYFLAVHGDCQLADEQSANCFSALVECIPKMTGGAAQLRPFVFTVAKNVVRSHWRIRTRERTRPLSQAELLDHCSAPDAAMQAAEKSERLIAAIRSLEQPTRDVFLLRFVEQMSLAEIASVVGEPIGTVKSRLHRGRQRLQKILQCTKGFS